MRLANKDVEDKVRSALAELPQGPEDLAVTKHMLRIQRAAELRIAELVLTAARAASVSMNPYDRIAAARWEIVVLKEVDRCKSGVLRRRAKR